MSGGVAWTVGRLVQWTERWFAERGCSDSPRLDAELLLAYALGYDRLGLYLNFRQPLVAGELSRFKTLIRRRAAGEPVAYILGCKEFYGRRFAVNRQVLIPRPDSETLVEAVLTVTGRQGWDRQPVELCELGVGSGALLISLLLSRPGWRGWAVDISPAALAVARGNACNHRVEERISWWQSDWFGSLPEGQRFHCLISNPPYLSGREWEADRSRLGWEPRLALVGGDDGLEAILKIGEAAGQWLHSPGWLLMEVGAGQSQRLKAVDFPGLTLDSVFRDINQIERVLAWRTN
ncbi:MAG: peptide chain release factor N(5)-glutamine methyltransferase [Negativicutes bacterium]|nr:peptide chain release factor N(5)-glutamine methyltransferase [Negativicutes bacterium]